MNENLNKKFINKFKPSNFGFYDLTPFVDAKLGFSLKKKLNANDNNNITVLNIYVPNNEYNDHNKKKKLLNISLIYGKEAEQGGVYIRQEVKLKDPIDVTFPNEYYYDVSNENFYKKDKLIDPDQIIKEVYDMHIKSTKHILGFYIRSKIWLNRVFMNLLFVFISKLFSRLIWLISGDVYKYGFSEHINKKLNIEKKQVQDKLLDKPGEKVNFLGYAASPECILFYSLFHFLIYGVFYYFEIKFNFIMMIFRNAFLTLIYVMASLTIIDKALPMFFKKIVDKTFDLSIYFSTRSIKL